MTILQELPDGFAQTGLQHSFIKRFQIPSIAAIHGPYSLIRFGN